MCYYETLYSSYPTFMIRIDEEFQGENPGCLTSKNSMSKATSSKTPQQGTSKIAELPLDTLETTLPRFYTVEETAEYLGIKVKKVHEHVRNGKLQCVQLSAKVRMFTEEQIKDIALMPKSKQYIAISKLAAGIAYFKTISKYRQAMDDLLEAMRAPGLDDVQRGVLERDYNYLKEKLDRFKEERQAYKDYNETVSGILSESEKEKLNAIINNDRTTSYFSDSDEAQDKKEMYLPSVEDKNG